MMRNAKIDIEGDMDTLMKELREREERGEPAPTSYDVGRNGYTPVGGRHTRKIARPGKCVCGCQIVLAVLLVLALLRIFARCAGSGVIMSFSVDGAHLRWLVGDREWTFDSAAVYCHSSGSFNYGAAPPGSCEVSCPASLQIAVARLIGA